MGPDVLKLLALNVRGGGAPRAKSIARTIAGHDADLVVLGEAYPSGVRHVVLEELGKFGYNVSVTAHGDTPRVASAVAIASRIAIDRVRQPLAEGPNRQRLLEIEVGDLLVVGAYFPLDRNKAAFWREEFLPYVAPIANRGAVLLGDWNTGLHSSDETGATFFAAAEFASLLERGWVDAWRARHGATCQYTWYSNAGNGFRIDHAFVSPAVFDRVLEVKYDHTTREHGVSDHSALIVDVALQVLERPLALPVPDAPDERLHPTDGRGDRWRPGSRTRV